MKISKLLVFMIVLLSLTLGGCYWNYGVGSSEVGVVMDDGISVSAVVGPGRYSNGGWYSDMKTVDLTVKTATWNDPSLVTSDKQPIGLTLGLSYKRMGDTDSIKAGYNTYRNEMFDDGALQTLVFSRVPDVAKGATNRYNIDQLIGRAGIDQDIFSELREELAKVYVELISVQIQDVAVDETYLQKLKEKAAVIVERETAAEQVLTAEQNLKKEKAQTEIQLELARRQNLVNMEMAKAYEQSPELMELRRLELLRDIIGPNDKLIFVPEGSSLSVINNSAGSGQVVPVE